VKTRQHPVKTRQPVSSQDGPLQSRIIPVTHHGTQPSQAALCHPLYKPALLCLGHGARTRTQTPPQQVLLSTNPFARCCTHSPDLLSAAHTSEQGLRTASSMYTKPSPPLSSSASNTLAFSKASTPASWPPSSLFTSTRADLQLPSLAPRQANTPASCPQSPP